MVPRKGRWNEFSTPEGERRSRRGKTEAMMVSQPHQLDGEILTDPKKRKLSVRLKPGLRAPKEGREALRRLGAVVPPEALERIELLISELVTNAVVHAGLSRDSWIDLRLSIGRRSVRAEVWDPGPPFEVEAKPRPGTSSRWGLYLVSRMSDRWGVREDGGKGVWFEISW